MAANGRKTIAKKLPSPFGPRRLSGAAEGPPPPRICKTGGRGYQKRRRPRLWERRPASLLLYQLKRRLSRKEMGGPLCPGPRPKARPAARLGARGGKNGGPAGRRSARLRLPASRSWREGLKGRPWRGGGWAPPKTLAAAPRKGAKKRAGSPSPWLGAPGRGAGAHRPFRASFLPARPPPLFPGLTPAPCPPRGPRNGAPPRGAHFFAPSLFGAGNLSAPLQRARTNNSREINCWLICWRRAPKQLHSAPPKKLILKTQKNA
jgi:hypothetical protein